MINDLQQLEQCLEDLLQLEVKLINIKNNLHKPRCLITVIEAVADSRQQLEDAIKLLQPRT